MARSLMTKRQAVAAWRAVELPYVKKEFEQDGVPDYPARCQSWNDWIDGMVKDGQLTERAGNWDHPPENTRPGGKA